jgi:hypothetical protein
VGRNRIALISTTPATEAPVISTLLLSAAVDVPAYHYSQIRCQTVSRSEERRPSG